MSINAIVLAAGQGVRMRSTIPKVAHPVMGRPLLTWVLQSLASISPDRTVVVVGHGAEAVQDLLPDGVESAIQQEQLGTGHATAVGLDALGGLADDDLVIVAYGDMPLMTPRLFSDLLSASSTGPVLTTIDTPRPSGYGRVIRDAEGSVVDVVEEKDCTEEQRAITEINVGLYAVGAGALTTAVRSLSAVNAQGEYYLTDIVSKLVAAGSTWRVVPASIEEVAGVNSQDQLAEAGAALRREINAGLMASGVWMQDPDRTYIDAGVVVEPGARIYPGVHLEGSTVVGADAVVGPDVLAVDSEIGAGSVVMYSVLRGAVVGSDCHVGPYASLRKGTVLGDGAKAGTFVETKNTMLGPGAKAPHLSYLGDATVGARSNIGAGTITCNYDGFDKHPTVIGEDAFIGSDTMLVAPLRIGDRALTGAGSVISRDVAEDALAVERTEQKEIPGYAQRRAERRAKKASED